MFNPTPPPETHTTQHLEKVLYALYKTSMEPALAADIDRCTQTLAQFIEPAVWKPFVLSALAGSSSGKHSSVYLRDKSIVTVVRGAFLFE